MKYLKALCAVGFLVVLVSNVVSISGWNEIRGVYDDICYLRQAHLFQKLGPGGLDTDIAGDDDRYLSSRLKEIDFPTWSDPTTAPCHTLMPATNRLVIQYPPGTGFVLALFPSGFQVIPLYVLASVVAFGFALLAIAYTSTIFSLMLVTARLFLAEQRRDRLLLAGLVGLLLGAAVNFRLANLFLSAGYFVFFAFVFLRLRKLEEFLKGGLFGVAYLVGIAPTLISNTINAGSPFATTYGADPNDLRPPVIDAGVVWAYVTDLQFVLLILAAVWVALISRLYRGSGIRSVALVTALNLAVNVAFFLTHPTFNPYYTVPIAMLSLWSLLFASLMRPAESGDDRLMGLHKGFGL